MFPHFEQIIRGPIAGTGTSSPQRLAVITTSGQHFWHAIKREWTPLRRMWPSVMGSIAAVERLGAIGSTPVLGIPRTVGPLVISQSFDPSSSPAD
jgi:hypothetical protein